MRYNLGDNVAKIPKVDKEKCIGCGVCVSIAPEVFELGDDGKSHVRSKACDKKCEEAANACPVGAITIVEK